MNTTAKCPKCEEGISNIHYEAHNPSSLSGFRGSASFTAVAFPCGHALGAVPVTWELRLEELDKTGRELTEKISNLEDKISELSDLIRNPDLKED